MKIQVQFVKSTRKSQDPERVRPKKKKKKIAGA